MCDTLVVMPAATADGSVIFAKNSDREANEPQALEYHPPAEHAPGSMVSCTYLRLPQVPRTRGVLLSRPVWMWGAEMGVNDAGVVIGNEAVFTRMPKPLEKRLLGMDMLRLALERCDSAEAALDTLVELLAEYGQGGPAGYRDKSFAYHNSFLIADARDAWVLETAGHLWAARRIRERYAISNGLTIGAEYDHAHPDVASFAREKGSSTDRDTFSFADAYGDPLYRVMTGCRVRRSTSEAHIQRSRGARRDTAAGDPAAAGGFTLADAFAALRDHGDEDRPGAGRRSYRPDRHLRMTRVCAHAANGLTRHGAQSTASLVVRITPAGPTCWATGTSAPCTSVFKPIWLDGEVLPDIGPTPAERFEERSLWWRHECLHRRMLRDLPAALARLDSPRAELEAELLRRAADAPVDGASAEHRFSITRDAFDRARALEDEVLADPAIRDLPRHTSLRYRLYWARQNRRAGVPG